MSFVAITGRAGMASLLTALDAGAGATRLVGGCVRDTLLGLAVNDIDLATQLAPDETLSRLKAAQIKAVPTGIEHGTVTAILPSGPVEVTTLRRDVATDGRRATVAFTDDWQEDAARRDFTINALSADPSSGHVHDYFGGRADIEKRLVRFIGDPMQRIAEDHLRILRFFRFHARFGAGAPDAESLAACIARANDLMALSRERIADELLKLLALPSPEATVLLMVETGIFAPVLPEIDGKGAQALKRLVEAEEEAGIPADPVRRLAALLPRDVGLATALGTRLRLSNKIVKRLAVSAQEMAGDAAPEAIAYRLGQAEAIDRLLLAGDPSGAASLVGWERPQLLVRGGDLVAMGLQAGPVVAKTFQALEREWSRLGFPGDLAVQQSLARTLVDQALREAQ